jgi:hypothetical protein
MYPLRLPPRTPAAHHTHVGSSLVEGRARPRGHRTDGSLQSAHLGAHAPHRSPHSRALATLGTALYGSDDS